MEPGSPELGARSLSHWAAREVPCLLLSQEYIINSSPFLSNLVYFSPLELLIASFYLPGYQHIYIINFFPVF